MQGTLAELQAELLMAPINVFRRVFDPIVIERVGLEGRTPAHYCAMKGVLENKG